MLISSAVFSGLQRPFEKLPNRLTDGQTGKKTTTKRREGFFFPGVIYFPPWQRRRCAPYCILTILQVCIIWAYKNKSCGNHLDEAGLYETICPALLHCFIEQTNAQVLIEALSLTHTHTEV